MTPRNCRRAIFILTIAVLLAPLCWAQTGREFHWSGKLAPEKIVEIKNINGTIDAQVTGGDQVEVTAEKIGPRADEVKIEVVPHADGVTICAIYSGGLFGGSGSCEPGERWHANNTHGDRTKVNFTVRLPENLRFAGQSVNGDVRAQDMGRFVRASTVNGSVRVSTKAWAELSSVNGSIEASMGRADWTGILKISTVNGSVKLEMPGNMNADVRFRSVNGRLNTDFPLSVSGSLGGRKVEGRIGNGGRELVVETVNGNVELKREIHLRGGGRGVLHDVDSAGKLNCSIAQSPWLQYFALSRAAKQQVRLFHRRWVVKDSRPADHACPPTSGAKSA